MFKISDKVLQFIIEMMKNSKVELTTGGKTLEEVKIQRGVFEGVALWPFLFVKATISLN